MVLRTSHFRALQAHPLVHEFFAAQIFPSDDNWTPQIVCVRGGCQINGPLVPQLRTPLVFCFSPRFKPTQSSEANETPLLGVWGRLSGFSYKESGILEVIVVQASVLPTSFFKVGIVVTTSVAKPQILGEHGSFCRANLPLGCHSY
jgi:hypothetical protein